MNVFFLFVVFIHITTSESEDCSPRSYGNGSPVCVCNATYCDKIPPVKKTPHDQYLIYTSNKAGLRFKLETATFENVRKYKNQITIDPNKEYQEIHGWGGAFTDAAGINILSLKDTVKEKLMESYFGEDGIGYNYCRVPIGGTDFSTHPYSYNEKEELDLTSFSLSQEDFLYKIPLIKQAQKLSKHSLRLIASAWIAPKWMKTNGAYDGAFGFLKKNAYQSWALYFRKFLDEYAKNNLTFWGITTGNEPSLAYIPRFLQKIPSVAWLPKQMVTFLKENLGPTIRHSKHSDIKIMVLDDQRIFLPWFVDQVFSDQQAKQYTDGISVHWYQDDKYSASHLAETHNKFPDKFILATEACAGSRYGDQHVILGSWERAEEYAFDIIEDVNNWVTGWIQWNLALDQTGGPTYISNNVDSTIIVNASSEEFYKQPMFYAHGHFSKFIPVGSKKIYISQLVKFNSLVAVTAFKNPNNGTVIVILNRMNLPLELTLLKKQEERIININVEERSLTTLLYW